MEGKEMNKLSWASNMKKLERNNRVVLTNTDTGNWIKISKDIFNQVSKKQLNEFSQDKMQDTLKSCTCGACKKEICIDYKGDIYPCVLLVKEEYRLGNIFCQDEVCAISDRERLETLSSFKKFEKLYPDKIENCKKCDVNLFCWTCLHFADIYIDTDNFQERCQAKKEALGKLIWDME